jgi:gamma-glutamylputrescine oxidase
MEAVPVWRTGDGPARPSLSGVVEADVCVIGLGGSGLAAVAEAVRLGRSVVGLDAGEVACGAAGRNGGFLLAGAPDFHHLAVAALGRERAAAVYRLTLAEIDAVPTARRVGSLRIGDGAEELADCEAMLAALRADGFEAEPYDGPEGAGVLMPGDAAFDPLARCRLTAEALTPEPLVRLFERSPVLSLSERSLSEQVVATSEGSVRSRAVVVAVDGLLERLLSELAPRLRTARLQMLATAPVAAVVAPRPVYARWGYDYWQQLPSGAIALGGCRDRFLNDEWAANEWAAEAQPTEAVQACLDRLLRERLGLADVPVTHRWAGLVGFTADRMPVCEQVRPGVFAAGGYCGTGNLLGALCGRAVMRLALGEPAGDLELLLSTPPQAQPEAAS